MCHALSTFAHYTGKILISSGNSYLGKEMPIAPQHETRAFNAKLVPNHEQLSAIKF